MEQVSKRQKLDLVQVLRDSELHTLKSQPWCYPQTVKIRATLKEKLQGILVLLQCPSISSSVSPNIYDELQLPPRRVPKVEEWDEGTDVLGCWLHHTSWITGTTWATNDNRVAIETITKLLVCVSVHHYKKVCIEDDDSRHVT